MERMKGPFDEDLFFKRKNIKTLLNKKKHYYFVDDFFKTHPDFKGKSNFIFLKSGEHLKTLESLSKKIDWLLSKNVGKSDVLVAVGGGSLGDSVGFLASIYLRGVDFIQVPTTWLAAVDSSVGGKAALNHKRYKNQIGTVHKPKEIYFFEELLKSSQIVDSEGEILKTLFLNINRKWSKSILKNWKNDKIKFSDLIKFVAYKISVVKKDIKDTKDLRIVLNLGHTLGHALELKFKLSHSEAVKKGLLFSLRWSFKKKYLSLKNTEMFISVLNQNLPVIKDKDLESLVLKDKKVSNKSVKFIFLTDRGPLVEKIKISDVVKEYKRQSSNEF